MALLERKDCLRLRDLFDSLSDGTYTYEKGEGIIELLLKYESPLVNKIEAAIGKPLNCSSVEYFCSADEISDTQDLSELLDDPQCPNHMEVELKIMHMQFEYFFRMLDATNESIFHEPDDAGYAAYNRKNYTVTDYGTYVRCRNV